jgi:hypothetical protein
MCARIPVEIIHHLLQNDGRAQVERVDALILEVTMMPFEKCPVCGGELVAKEVEKVLWGAGSTQQP